MGSSREVLDPEIHSATESIPPPSENPSQRYLRVTRPMTSTWQQQRPTTMRGSLRTVSARRQRPQRLGIDSLDLVPSDYLDFLRKCRHVQKLLVAQQIPECSPDIASAWTLAFADEGDPTFCIVEWLESGWRDPLLVAAALRICGRRSSAEWCMSWLGKDHGRPYSGRIISQLARAMIVQRTRYQDAVGIP